MVGVQRGVFKFFFDQVKNCLKTANKVSLPSYPMCTIIFAWQTYFRMTDGCIQVFDWQKEYQKKYLIYGIRTEMLRLRNCWKIELCMKYGQQGQPKCNLSTDRMQSHGTYSFSRNDDSREEVFRTCSLHCILV